MKYLIIFAFLIGSISANALQPEVPSDENPGRIVDQIVIRAVNNITRAMQDGGLDPLEIRREARQYSLAVPEILTVSFIVEDLLIAHLSEILIDNLTFSLLTLNLNYAFRIQEILIRLGYGYVGVSGFGEKIDGTLQGSVSIVGGAARGNCRVLLGVEEISIRELNIDLTVERIESNISKLQVYMYDLTDRANELIGETIPQWMTDFREDINELLEILLWDPIERGLNADW